MANGNPGRHSLALRLAGLAASGAALAAIFAFAIGPRVAGDSAAPATQPEPVVIRTPRPFVLPTPAPPRAERRPTLYIVGTQAEATRLERGLTSATFLAVTINQPTDGWDVAVLPPGAPITYFENLNMDLERERKPTYRIIDLR